MAQTYTVVSGDCLWSIAERYLGGGWHYTEIQDLNGISRDDTLIYPGQVLKLTADSGDTPPTPADPPTTNLSAMPTVQFIGLQAGTDSTIFATWTWDHDNTKDYSIKWWYYTDNGVWFIAQESTVTDPQSVYSAPANAKIVSIHIKANSYTRKVNDVDTEYWTSEWSTESKYYLSNNPPKQVSTPTVTIEKYRLTAELKVDADVNANQVEFEVVKDNQSIFATGIGQINTDYVSYSCNVNAGSEYKVRCRAFRDGGIYGKYSDYSENIKTIPSPLNGFNECRANSTTSVYLSWNKVDNAKTYDIEYATKLSSFDITGDTTIINSIETLSYEKTGLTSGADYFFRIRAVNDAGHSEWSNISTTVVGKKPSAPTTWSSTTTAIVGETLNLYWVHNSADGSSQTFAELYLEIDGTSTTYTIQNTTDEDLKDKTSCYSINTSQYQEGTVIKWRVRTAGVTKVYGNWSVERVVDVYAPPTLELDILNSDGNHLGGSVTFTGFPIIIKALAGPASQMAIGYHIDIISNGTYTTSDIIGNAKTISIGESIYSKYADSSSLELTLSAMDVDFQNNISYTVVCTVSMNSGLTTQTKSTFRVQWTDTKTYPNAEIAIDKDKLVAYIRPYCKNGSNKYMTDVYLSVYRREFDGTFTEIATGLDGSKNIFVTDPHPALDLARYRVIAINKNNGNISYYNVPGKIVDEKAIVIQWDEDWFSFDANYGEVLANSPWSGSMLKLPYNIDVSENHSSDISLVNYIGRKHPVSYYGTQVGETASWSVDIESTDTATIYALRRLAIYMGNVYVREPSGTGYWATVKVSFSQKHCGVIIPVTFDITRVEGGM